MQLKSRVNWLHFNLELSPRQETLTHKYQPWKASGTVKLPFTFPSPHEEDSGACTLLKEIQIKRNLLWYPTICVGKSFDSVFQFSECWTGTKFTSNGHVWHVVNICPLRQVAFADTLVCLQRYQWPPECCQRWVGGVWLLSGIRSSSNLEPHSQDFQECY